MKKKLLIIMAVSLVWMLTACANASPSPNTNGDTPQDTQEPNTDEPSEPETNPTLAIGDSSALKDWEISVTDFSFSDRIEGDYSYFSPDEGNQYAVVSASITNNGKEADTFLPMFSTTNDVRSTIYYGDGYEYSSTSLLAYDADLHDSHMNPLTSKDGIIAFSVPDAVASSEEPLSIEFSAGSEKIVFSLR